MSVLTDVKYNLEWVIAYWPDLTESRLHTKPARWGQMALSGERAEERDHQVRIERWEATTTAAMPGQHPAPVNVAVLDLMTSILTEAEDLAWTLVREISSDRRSRFSWPGPPSTGFADARPYLTVAHQLLTGHLPDLAEWAAPITGRMASQTAHALALVADGQVLNIVCPWCHGVTAEAPHGGARTWRIRNLLADQECLHSRPRRFCDECEQHIAIVCDGICEPPPREVGTWWKGSPCWPLTAWRWLGRRVMSEAEQTAQARALIAS